MGIVCLFLAILIYLHGNYHAQTVIYQKMGIFIKNDLTDSRVGAFASKSGSKYYFSWCSSRVKPENKIYFPSEQWAINSGYEKARNC